MVSDVLARMITAVNWSLCGFQSELKGLECTPSKAIWSNCRAVSPFCFAGYWGPPHKTTSRRKAHILCFHCRRSKLPLTAVELDTLNPNTDKVKSRSIQSPLEITLKLSCDLNALLEIWRPACCSFANFPKSTLCPVHLLSRSQCLFLSTTVQHFSVEVDEH